jgi:hypothetical protein
VSGGDGSTPAEPGDLPATEARSANQAALFDPRVEQLAASEAVLTAAIHRMERIARNEAIRAAKDPAKYSARLDAFWIDHGKVLEEALRLPLRAVAAIRGPANGFHSTDEELSAMIGEYTQEKREALLKAAECRPEELAARVAEAVKDWGCP